MRYACKYQIHIYLSAHWIIFDRYSHSGINRANKIKPFPRYKYIKTHVCWPRRMIAISQHKYSEEQSHAVQVQVHKESEHANMRAQVQTTWLCGGGAHTRHARRHSGSRTHSHAEHARAVCAQLLHVRALMYYYAQVVVFVVVVIAVAGVVCGDEVASDIDDRSTIIACVRAACMHTSARVHVAHYTLHIQALHVVVVVVRSAGRHAPTSRRQRRHNYDSSRSRRTRSISIVVMRNHSYNLCDVRLFTLHFYYVAIYGDFAARFASHLLLVRCALSLWPKTPDPKYCASVPWPPQNCGHATTIQQI